jgi:hypothetical protein
MQEPRRTPKAPWIAASSAAVVLVALVLVYFVFLRPDERHADGRRAAAAQQIGRFTVAETAAMRAAATEMTNLVTFSRDHFDSDFQRALDGATGSLRHDVAKNREKTLQQMTRGRFDLYGRLTHKALEAEVRSGSHRGYVVLVAINGYRSTAPDTPIQQNLEVSVIDVDGEWLANDVTNIGVTA